MMKLTYIIPFFFLLTFKLNGLTRTSGEVLYQERTQSDMRASSSRWNKLRQLWRLADDRKALRFASLCSFGPAFRFSTRLGCLGRGSALSHHWLDQIASQDQMIVGNGNNVAPALKLRWGAQTSLRPQQRLFVKAVAVFLAEATRRRAERS